MAKGILSFVGGRQLVALGILACTFVALMAFHLSVWSFVAVSVLFIGYASWAATAFFASQQNLNSKTIAACAWPIGVAVLQALVCLGLVWLIVWSAHQVFGH